MEPVPRVVVIGAGGFGREVLDLIFAINDGPAGEIVRVDGVLADPAPPRDLLDVLGVSYLGPPALLNDLDQEVQFVVAIGDPAVRRRIAEGFRDRRSPVLIHPNACVGRNVSILGGSIICSHVTVGNHARLDEHVHVNANSAIGHDATISAYATISPLVGLSGNVLVEQGAFVGTGTVVNPGVRLGEACRVGSGAAVVADVAARSTVVGVPARPI